MYFPILEIYLIQYCKYILLHCINTFTVLENTFTRPLIARVHWPIHMLIDPAVIILMHAPPYCNLFDYG